MEDRSTWGFSSSAVKKSEILIRIEPVVKFSMVRHLIYWAHWGQLRTNLEPQRQNVDGHIICRFNPEGSRRMESQAVTLWRAFDVVYASEDRFCTELHHSVQKRQNSSGVLGPLTSVKSCLDSDTSTLNALTFTIGRPKDNWCSPESNLQTSDHELNTLTN